MTDWPELDELIRKREEAERQRISLQNAKEEEERQKQTAFQEKVILSRPRFIELLSYWDKVVNAYLTHIAKGTWKGWQGQISKSLENAEPTEDQIKLSIANQLKGYESKIKWHVHHDDPHYYYEVCVSVKDFQLIRLVVVGKNEHVVEPANEEELKKVLLITFQEGPLHYESSSWGDWSLN